MFLLFEVGRELVLFFTATKASINDTIYNISIV